MPAGGAVMPKNTFLNLSEEKRQAFTDESLREFGLNTYRTASVSRIVEKLGIAKGSVYQYFANKTDLYRYLVDLSAAEKLAFIRRTLDLPGSVDFYDAYTRIVLAGAEFDFSHPKYSLMIAGAMQERGTPEIAAIARNLEQQSFNFLNAYVQRGIESGDVRSDVDDLLVVHFVNAVTLELVAYMERKFDFSLADHLREPDRPLPFSEADLHTAVTSSMGMLRKGLSKT